MKIYIFLQKDTTKNKFKLNFHFNTIELKKIFDKGLVKENENRIKKILCEGKEVCTLYDVVNRNKKIERVNKLYEKFKGELFNLMENEKYKYETDFIYTNNKKDYKIECYNELYFIKNIKEKLNKYYLECKKMIKYYFLYNYEEQICIGLENLKVKKLEDINMEKIQIKKRYDYIKKIHKTIQNSIRCLHKQRMYRVNLNTDVLNFIDIGNDSKILDNIKFEYYYLSTVIEFNIGNDKKNNKEEINLIENMELENNDYKSLAQFIYSIINIFFKDDDYDIFFKKNKKFIKLLDNQLNY